KGVPPCTTIWQSLTNSTSCSWFSTRSGTSDRFSAFGRFFKWRYLSFLEMSVADTFTRYPSFRNLLVTWLPMNPEPPIMPTVFMVFKFGVSFISRWLHRPVGGYQHIVEKL